MQNQMVDSNINSLKVSLNQLENVLSQIDNAFVEYWNQDESYACLKNMKPDAKREEYLIYMSDTATWLEKQYKAHQETQGAFAYYENLDLLVFRGSTNFQMHEYIKEQLKQRDVFNHWEIITIDGLPYLVNLKNYVNFYGGVWMPMTAVYEHLGIQDEHFLGNMYFMDYQNRNTADQPEIHKALTEQGTACQGVSADGVNYNNYTVTTKNLSMGILIPQSTVISMIPLFNKIIFAVAFLSVFLVPIVVLWLRKKIANPIREIDRAMAIIGEGGMEYRIPLLDKKYYDEFDRLSAHFNKMMDELNELEFNLYKTKIKEQRTELKYISQQIRPHFILNALNIIYTYEENEFHLVKKMVLYLSEYFRYIVNLRVDFVGLEKELRHVENYLKIQKERYLNGFDYFVEWEAQIGECLVPPLIIQTFVENCIKYAMKNDEKTFIYVLASEHEGRLKLMIADTGNGFTDEVMEHIRMFIDTREYQEELGVGIQNAIERMDILYENGASVKVRNALSGGAVVEIYLPLMM